ncbi:hypothetical protein A9G37_03525 [Gilliamella sp. GillExp13]|nr:hypothetical protein A9G37_03525 [Gilliamella apicola]
MIIEHLNIEFHHFTNKNNELQKGIHVREAQITLKSLICLQLIEYNYYKLINLVKLKTQKKSNAKFITLLTIL